MKKFGFKIRLTAIAFVMAIAAAFAFNANPTEETAWFRLNEQGNPIGSALPSEPLCDFNENIECSARYAVDAQGNPQGAPQEVKMGEYVGL